MKVKRNWLLIPLLGCSVSVGANEITNNLNYNFLYADLAAGSLNENLGTNNNVTSLAVGANYLWTPSMLTTLDYNARFIHPGDITTELYTLKPSIAYRYVAAKNVDFIVAGSVGYLWASQTIDDTDQRLFKDHELFWGTSLELKYALDRKWELSTKGELNSGDLLDEVVFTVRADYRFGPRMTVGGFYSHRDGDFETQRISGSATTNEGGVSLRYALW